MEVMSEIIKRIKENQEKGEKGEIIQNNDMEVSFKVNCIICNDSGFVHPRIDGKVDYGQVIPCVCMKEKNLEHRKQVMMRSCELPPMAERMMLKNFKLFPELKTAFNTAKEVIENTNKSHWVTFQGINGTGKTHLAVAICNAWIKKLIPARYAFVPLLLEELREGFQDNTIQSYQQRYNYFRTVTMLVLDDLGVENPTAWVLEKLTTIIDYRLMNNLSLIVTTNCTLDELPDRISSRLVRHPEAKVININAPEYVLREK